MTIKTEKIVLSEERNVSLVTMTQSVGEGFGGITERPGIVILPGGGYAMCSDGEAENVAYPYLSAGYHAFVLRYSVGKYNTWPNPLNDYEQAMEYIRKNSKEWGLAVDKIAVIGFSAGGHLAACAATMAKNRPAAAILGYPAILKDICDMCSPGLPQPNEHVDELTPPCFLFAASDDTTVSVKNMIRFEEALIGKGLKFESHIYEYGEHGFSTAEEYLHFTDISPRVKNWVAESIGWLSEVLGRFTANGIEKPVSGKFVNADCAPTFSVNCTLGYLLKQGEPAKSLLGEPRALIDAGIQKGVFSAKAFEHLKQTVTLKSFLTACKMPEDKIEKLNEELQSIPNNKQ